MSAVNMIPAVIEDKFQVAKFSSFGPNAGYSGTPRTIVHKGVKLTFTLILRTNQTVEEFRNCIGVFMTYSDGPKEILNLNFNMFAVRDSIDARCKPLQIGYDLNDEFIRSRSIGSGLGITALPRELELLTAANWLRSDNTILHIMAVLLIPESAFDDPEKKYQIITNPFFQWQFSQVNTPVDTSSPYNFGRFDFISSDGQHFYVHKDVLSFHFDSFKQMFDSSKPEDAQFEYIKKGFMEIKNLDAGALKEMFSYIYLGHTTPEFGKSVSKVVVGADMYGLHGLMLLCERKLIAQTKQMKEINDVLCNYELSDRHKLPGLTTAAITVLMHIIIGHQIIPEDQLISIIELSIEHKHGQLTEACEQKIIVQLQALGTGLTEDKVQHFVSVAMKYELKKLEDRCGAWLAHRNWHDMENGLNSQMEDKRDGLLQRILGRVLSTHRSSH